MPLRRTAGWLVAIATAAAATLALATPANAATVNVTATCSAGGVVVDNDDVVAVPGDIIFIRNSTGVTVTIQNAAGGSPGTSSLSNGAGTNFSVTAANGGFDLVGAAGCNTFAASVTFSATPRTSGPPPVIQQFGKPASGTCDAAAPTTLNWSGVGSGGWGNSWAQWMNGGLGGPVCSRMLVYSLSRGQWVIG